jgi:hypothetical protein
MELEDGTRVERTRGTPQGGVVSPILANLFMHYIDTFLEQPVTIGRKTSSVTHAVRLIDEYVEESNPSLTPPERENLCTELFDKVRARHGDRRRSPDCEPEETPRYRDLLTKLMTKRPARPRMRKTAQKTG